MTSADVWYKVSQQAKHYKQWLVYLVPKNIEQKYVSDILIRSKQSHFDLTFLIRLVTLTFEMDFGQAIFFEFVDNSKIWKTSSLLSDDEIK